MYKHLYNILPTKGEDRQIQKTKTKYSEEVVLEFFFHEKKKYIIMTISTLYLLHFC